MFTGIIEELAIVKNLSIQATGATLTIGAKKASSDAVCGDSIAVNGICLTIVENNNGILKFDVSGETFQKSNIGSLKSGDSVNIERALCANSRLGGHFLTGHIDDTSKIKSKKRIDNTIKLEIALDKQFSNFIVQKGSIAVDGISLTVGEVLEGSFTVYIIPHTLTNTTLEFKKESDSVNIEFDILAKYVNKSTQNKSSSNVTVDFLSKHGFLS